MKIHIEGERGFYIFTEEVFGGIMAAINFLRSNRQVCSVDVTPWIKVKKTVMGDIILYIGREAETE